MRAGLIILGIIIIAGMWFITNTQVGKTLPLTGHITALPSIEPVTYLIGFLILLMGIFLGKRAKSKIEAQEEEEEGPEEESEEEPVIEEE
jgi:large-conductance mechanosensitive channel